jgi:hypothetical protein
MTWRPLRITDDGRVTDVKFDSDGRIIVRTREEVAPILDHNKAIRNHGTPAPTIDGWRHYATIPNTVVHKWLQEGIDVWSGECQDALARKLNDPDWAYLRTNTGRIGVSNGVAR